MALDFKETVAMWSTAMKIQLLMTVFCFCPAVFMVRKAWGEGGPSGSIPLPAPDLTGKTPLEKLLQGRRSVRSYAPGPLALAEVSQLLWAAQGITSRAGLRTAPSAGALYPLEVFLVVGGVDGLSSGVYRYLPGPHALLPHAAGDRRDELGTAALGQDCVRTAAVVVVVTAVEARTTRKYGSRGIQYVHMEVGHAAQNIYLQAAALRLGTVFVGAFVDAEVKRILALPVAEQPLGLMPIGRVNGLLNKP